MIGKKSILTLFILATFTLSGCEDLIAILDAYSTVKNLDKSTTSSSTGNTTSTISKPSKKIITIFDNFNKLGVSNQPTMSTKFTTTEPLNITEIQTYHWNNGKGSKTGTHSLQNNEGVIYGPWNAVGKDGMGGVPNANWHSYPNITIPAGRYIIIDSDEATWSANSSSDNKGFAIVSGYPITSITTPTTTIETTTANSISKPYIQGDMFGMDKFYSDLNGSFGKTSGALLQAILAVNSFLFTDNSITSFETFQLRKLEADRALEILDSYAKQTELIINQSENASFGKKSYQVKNALNLNPEDVLATVSSGPANKQIKTLMQKYQVDAHAAKDILDNAMAGLTSQYNKDANFYDTATRTATLIKEGAGLSLTIAGSIVTAGGVTGSLALGEAAITLITGTDGIIKVTKAGMELVLGKDLKQPTGTAGNIVTILSDTSEIISFNGLKKWTDAPDKISNIFNIILKTNDALQDKTINLGAHTIDISNLTQDTSSLTTNDIPTTLPGIYNILGQKVEVKTLPESVINILKTLPDNNKVESKTEEIPTPSPTLKPTAIPTPTPSKSTDGICSTPFDEDCYIKNVPMSSN